MKRAQSIRREFRREAGLRRAARRIGFRDGNGPPPAGCRFLSRCMVADSIFCATTRLSRATIPPDEYGMKVRANPRYEAFFAHLQETKRPFAKWEGVAFRATPLPHANAVKLLDGKGSFKTGGRWSAAGTFRAVNLSTSQETAVKESSASFTYYNFAPSDVRPKVLVGVRLRLSKVLDLVDPRGRRTLPWVGLEELLAEDWRKVNDAGHEALSQALGRAAHASGAEGLLVPSARVPGGINVVYFPDSLAASSEVEILGEDELTRWLKKC